MYLDLLREESRQLLNTNEFAVNAVENRINYVIGQGHRYRVVAKDGGSKSVAGEVQHLLDNFLEENDWTQRQREMFKRRDRDGEVFVRITPDSAALAKIRFLDPEKIVTPPQHFSQDNAAFGILTSPNDVETVWGYWFGDKFFDEKEIHHRKANVDSNVKRGKPLLVPVFSNLYRAEKLLRNMSTVSNIQTAIAMIRKHEATSRDAIKSFVENQASKIVRDEDGEVSKTYQQFAPGTIIDTNSLTEYVFPTASLNAENYIAVLQAELRAIASMLVMPEFMLSSDAGNANYSSTMIAEGPAVRMFERLQHEVIREDLRLFRKVFEVSSAHYCFDKTLLDKVTFHTIPPPLAVRDRLKETQADALLYNLGVMSKETLAMRCGLEPEREGKLSCKC